MNGDVTAARLRRLAQAAEADDLAAEIAALEERVRERRFHVACVGQFKRGKSSLVNALVGFPLLPTGVVPVTSVPTVVRHGPLGARVRFAEAWRSVSTDQLAEFVTEQHNRANTKGVLSIEVLFPSPILEQGLCLVDTPGLGSVVEANSAATREFIPHIDAALVVLGTDPPISGEELRLIEAIAAGVETLLFVINKADRVTAAERQEAAEFTRQVLVERLGLMVDRVYLVSAIDGGGGPDWTELTQRLRTLATADRQSLVTQATRRGITHLGAVLAARLRERADALMRPLKESEQRIEELRQLTEATERALRELNPLFGAEEQRLRAEFEERARVFLAYALPSGLAALQTAWAEGRFDHTSRIEGLDGANQIARGLVYSWLPQSELEAEAAFQETVRDFVRLGSEHLARLGGAVTLDPDLLGTLTLKSNAFRLHRRFAFSDRMRYHRYRSPWPKLIDALVPAAARRRRRQAAAERYLGDLLAANASRVTGDLVERVRESRREVEAEIRETRRRVYQSAADALEWSRTVRSRGAGEIESEVARLEELRDEIERLLEPMPEPAA
jgi:predicted GTPase/predicted  nucleic acid-binding Zn-ribbon protein